MREARRLDASSCRTFPRPRVCTRSPRAKQIRSQNNFAMLMVIYTSAQRGPRAAVSGQNHHRHTREQAITTDDFSSAYNYFSGNAGAW
jgi:hypothetical protein